MSLMGDWLLANFIARGLSACIFFFHIHEGRGAIFKGVSQESYFQILGLAGCGCVQMGLGLVCQGDFCCGGDGGPSPVGEGRGIISVGYSVRLAM